MTEMERSLSKREARIILELEWWGHKIITLSELHERLGGSEGDARVFAHRLVKKGWLERLKPGLFQLIPADRGPDGIADTHPLIAGTALADPYFFSFGTACLHYGFTDQVFAEVYIACQDRRRPAEIRGKRYVFVHVPEEQFFGHTEDTVLGQVVNIATTERALLDAIDRPRYSGGIREVSRIVRRSVKRISWESLLDLLTQWHSSALVQRLGYFLDLHKTDFPSEFRSELLKLIRPSSKIQLGARRKWGTTGSLIRPWNVVENVPRNALLPEGDVSRHPEVLPPKGGAH